MKKFLAVSKKIIVQVFPYLKLYISHFFLKPSLKRTQDILKYLGEHRREGQVICGFSMETENMLENSRTKLHKKNVDMICANNLKVAGAGFGVDTNVITIITKDAVTELPLLSKEAAANAILDQAIALGK